MNEAAVSVTKKKQKKIFVRIDPETLPKIAFAELFGNDGPVEVEIGCGQGKFLLARAAENPGINFLGIDYAGKWMKIGQVRGQKRKIANLQFMKGEARQILARFTAETSASSIFIFRTPGRRNAITNGG